ncbi:MAG: hypothetical protein ACOCWZ_09735 [Spirochaetota bacterium]
MCQRFWQVHTHTAYHGYMINLQATSRQALFSEGGDAARRGFRYVS